MSFTMSQASVPVFEIGLNALIGVLDKAAAHAAAKKIDQSVLVGWRLAPDMFALGRQVQVACDQAKNGSCTPRRDRASKVRRYRNDRSTSSRERIAKTVAFHQDARHQGD